jgi:hypothetical protein
MLTRFKRSDEVMMKFPATLDAEQRFKVHKAGGQRNFYTQTINNHVHVNKEKPEGAPDKPKRKG